MLFIFAVLLLIASLWAIFFSTLPYHWYNYPDCHVSGLCLYQSLVTDSGHSFDPDQSGRHDRTFAHVFHFQASL